MRFWMNYPMSRICRTLWKLMFRTLEAQDSYDLSRSPSVLFDSDAETKPNHIATLNDVILAFDAHFAGFLGFGFAAAVYEVVKCGYFRTDEAALEISVNRAGGFRRGAAYRDRT